MLGLDANVRECVNVLGDKSLLAKLLCRHMVATEVAHHLRCLFELHREAVTVSCNSWYQASAGSASGLS